MAQQASIFIGYRRDDTSDVAGRVYDALSQKFGADRVFKDVDNIRPGVNFGDYIRTILPKCRVFLVLIGLRWVDSPDERGSPRLQDPTDWVRIEIEKALQTPGLHIIPVLVNGAAVPRTDQLPVSLQPLLQLNAAVVRRDPDFHEDVRRLIEAIKPELNRSMTNSARRGRAGGASRWLAGAVLGAAVLGLVGAFAIPSVRDVVSRWLGITPAVAEAQAHPVKVPAATSPEIQIAGAAAAEPKPHVENPAPTRAPASAGSTEQKTQATVSAPVSSLPAEAPPPAAPNTTQIRPADPAPRVAQAPTQTLPAKTATLASPRAQPEPLPAQPIVIPATDYVRSRSQNVAIDECIIDLAHLPPGSPRPYALANAAPCTATPINAAEFDFTVARPGTYALLIEYAADGSSPDGARPTDILLNGSRVFAGALTQGTGGWQSFQFRQIGFVYLYAGKNTLRLQRAGVIPHIRTLRLEPSS